MEIGKPQHEVVVSPEKEPVPERKPAETPEPVREPDAVPA